MFGASVGIGVAAITGSSMAVDTDDGAVVIATVAEGVSIGSAVTVAAGLAIREGTADSPALSRSGFFGPEQAAIRDATITKTIRSLKHHE
jgi:hypothetical protein